MRNKFFACSLVLNVALAGVACWSYWTFHQKPARMVEQFYTACKTTSPYECDRAPLLRQYLDAGDYERAFQLVRSLPDGSMVDNLARANLLATLANHPAFQAHVPSSVKHEFLRLSVSNYNLLMRAQVNDVQRGVELWATLGDRAWMPFVADYSKWIYSTVNCYRAGLGMKTVPTPAPGSLAGGNDDLSVLDMAKDLTRLSQIAGVSEFLWELRDAGVTVERPDSPVAAEALRSKLLSGYQTRNGLLKLWGCPAWQDGVLDSVIWPDALNAADASPKS